MEDLDAMARNKKAVKTHKLKITFIGGGSLSVPNLARDMMLTDGISDSQFVLYDRNIKAGNFCKAFLDKLATQLGVKCTIVSTDNRSAALRGADYIVITISTGGLDAMSHDIAIPEKYGIYHTVGDTTGPAGWARSLRNFAVFVELADAINEYAPSAMILNYTNPMTFLIGVLSRRCQGNIIGLCSGLAENLAFIKDLYHLQSEAEISLKYGGLNHFFWITEAKAGKIDVITDLRQRLQKTSLTKLLQKMYKHEDPMGFSTGREIADELFRFTGAMPFMGDRHTCEFFPWYITNKQNMKKYRLKRTSVDDRRKGAQLGKTELEQALRTNPIPERYLKRSQESVAHVIAAHSSGGNFIDLGNTLNIGQISNLPFGTVVETPVMIDRNGITPLCIGSLPECVLGFIQPWIRVFSMITEACFNKDKALAIEALRLDPVCSHLNTHQIDEMAHHLLNAHKSFIRIF